jgi:hypothetical protein
LERKLFIHVGPMKTGTTALQNFLRDHDGSQVLYPKTGQFGSGAHHNLVYNFLGVFSNPIVFRDNCESMFERIAQEARQSDAPIVISSELLSLYNRTGEFIERLLHHLGGTYEVEILFTVREYFARAISIYSQLLKADDPPERNTPDEFLANRGGTVTYLLPLRTLAKTGCRIRTFNYDPAPQFVRHFLTHLGFPEDRIPHLPDRNRSLSTRAMVVRLAINRSTIAFERRQRLISELQKLRRRHTPASFIFSPDEAISAENRFDADRISLYREFGTTVPKRDLTNAWSAFSISKRQFERIVQIGADSAGERDDFDQRLREFVC